MKRQLRLFEDAPEAPASHTRSRFDELGRPPSFASPRPPMFPSEALVDGTPAPLSREQVRSRRKREVRASSVSMKRMTKRELELGRMLYPPDPDDPQRPRTRAECKDVPRPCPFVSCEHHLYLDVSARTGAIKLNFPDLEPHELPAEKSCALDIADRGGITLEDVGEAMNLTRERVRQIEVTALAKLQARHEMAALRDFFGDAVGTKRRLPVLSADSVERDRGDREIDPDEFAGDDLDDP